MRVSWVLALAMTVAVSAAPIPESAASLTQRWVCSDKGMPAPSSAALDSLPYANQYKITIENTKPGVVAEMDPIHGVIDKRVDAKTFRNGHGC